MFLNLARGDGDRLFASIPSTQAGAQPVLTEYRVTDGGLELQRSGPEDMPAAWVWSDGKLYSSNGRIRDAGTFAALPGIAGVVAASVAAEPGLDRAFFLSEFQGSVELFRAQISQGSVVEPLLFPYSRPDLGLTGPVRFGTEGIAFRADDTLHLVRSAYIEPRVTTDLRLTASPLPEGKIGQPFDWSLTVTNAGPGPASEIRIDGVLPGHLRFIQGQLPGGMLQPTFEGWTARLPLLPSGQSISMTLRLEPRLAGPVTLQVSAALLQRDTEPSNNTLVVPGFVRLDSGPDSWQALDLAAADLAYDPQTKQIWATVPDPAPDGQRDRLVRLDPDSGRIVAEFPAGRLPGRLIRSDDGRALFVALDGESVVRRFDLQTESWGATLALFDFPTNNVPARNIVQDWWSCRENRNVSWSPGDSPKTNSADPLGSGLWPFVAATVCRMKSPPAPSLNPVRPPGKSSPSREASVARTRLPATSWETRD